MEKNRPKVGVGVLIIKDSKILFGLRKSKLGEGTWSPTGGHLEFGEDVIECVRRETREEAGIELNKIEFLTYTNDIYPDKHYVTLMFKCSDFTGEPKVMEPEKWQEWRWFGKDKLPEDIFLPIKNLLDKWDI